MRLGAALQRSQEEALSLGRRLQTAETRLEKQSEESKKNEERLRLEYRRLEKSRFDSENRVQLLETECKKKDMELERMREKLHAEMTKVRHCEGDAKGDQLSSRQLSPSFARAVCTEGRGAEARP